MCEEDRSRKTGSGMAGNPDGKGVLTGWRPGKRWFCIVWFFLTVVHRGETRNKVKATTTFLRKRREKCWITQDRKKRYFSLIRRGLRSNVQNVRVPISDSTARLAKEVGGRLSSVRIACIHWIEAKAPIGMEV